MIEGFQTPESVLYDADQDAYLVSNVNGDAFAEDDNGFIARVSPEGKITEAKWIDGAKEDVKLNAPKGMAISGGVLWVSDINTLRTFDAKTGKPLKDYPMKGTTFLNDVAPGKDGGVYVSDSGLKAGFKPTKTDAIYQVSKDGKAKAIVSNKDALGNPNGIYAPGDGTLWVVTFGSGEIYQIDAAGKKGAHDKLPKGQNDGIVGIDGGEVLVSSWEGSAIFRGAPKPGADTKEPMKVEWKEAVTGVKAPADIGWDSKRRRVLIPHFQDNNVELRDLKD